MTGHWMQQTAAAIVGVHLLAAVVVAALIVVLVLPALHRRHIRRSQVLMTRIALAAWPPPSALATSPEGGQSTGGAGTPDSAPSVAPYRAVPRVVHRRPTPAGGVMDLLFGVAVAAVVGIPWAWSQLRQPTATPRGWHWISVPSRDPLAGPAREVGTPDLPNGGVPTSSTSGSDTIWAS